MKMHISKVNPSTRLCFDRLSIRPERAKSLDSARDGSRNGEQVEPRVEGLRIDGERSRTIKNFKFLCLILIFGFWILNSYSYAQDIKKPDVAGSFYPSEPEELSRRIDTFLSLANPQIPQGDILVIVVPHAGYEYSGQVAAFGYKLIKNKPYKTVVIISSSHYHQFRGISVYPKGIFQTPLGNVAIDEAFIRKMINSLKEIKLSRGFFKREHPIEVQIPFLQKSLSDFKIVPISIGQVNMQDCQNLAAALSSAIGERQDVLIVVSTDMYHGYDFQEAEIVDRLTLSYIEKMDPRFVYEKIIDNKIQLCGGFSLVTAMFLAKRLGYDKLNVLKYTNSAEVTARKIKGLWTVGYSSAVISRSESVDRIRSNPEGGPGDMLNKEQKGRLLKLARSSIEHYLKHNNRLEVSESDPQLTSRAGAFVTLHKHGQLRGCIGNLIGQKPLYLTIRDMAVEAAVGDPRFPPLSLSELNDVDIEISVLSPMKKIRDPDNIIMETHGVLVRKGFRSGVFLPQVATETGWSKEEFLSHLCSRKAGLSPSAWKDKDTEVYIFTASVFSEHD
jgi:AmmeMemoRadiSam system protein B/AmmeMemoRadiSam system protein A